MEVLNREPVFNIFKVTGTVFQGFCITGMLLNNNVLTINEPHTVHKAIVVQKEESTNIYTSSSCSNYGMIFDLPGYNFSSEIIGKDSLLINNEKVYNFNKFGEIATLSDNWNENGARAVPISLIDSVKSYINYLDIQPEIFPTVIGTLQLEYDKENGAHLEIEISEHGEADVFIMDAEDNVSTFKLMVSVQEINRVVREFYG